MRDATRGLTVGAVEGLIAPVVSGWRGDAPRVRVVGSAAELPEAIRRSPGSAEAEGVYWRGEVYLVASRLRSERRVLEVLAHEAIGHYGIEAITGPELWGEIGRLVKRMRESGQQGELFAELSRRGYRPEDPAYTREVVAVLAERGTRCTVLDRVEGACRRFLRGLGFRVEWSVAELRGLITRAARHVERSPEAAAAVDLEAAPAMRSDQSKRFYSALHDALIRSKDAPKVGTADVWRGWLDGAQRRGLFRQSERAWLDVDGWIARQIDAIRSRGSRQSFQLWEGGVPVKQGDDRSVARWRAASPSCDVRPSPKQPLGVTREALLDYVSANAVCVDEVVLGGDATPQYRVEEVGSGGYCVVGPEGATGDVFEFPEDAQRTADERNAESNAVGRPKYADYQILGGQNYREVLLTLRHEADRVVRPTVFERGRNDKGQALFDVVRNGAVLETFTTWSRAQDFALEVEEQERIEANLRQKIYKSSHWEQPNVLAHLRMNERIDVHGRKLLFVEEIQSDWHQAGRVRGYVTRPAARSLADLSLDELVELLRTNDPNGDWADPDNPVTREEALSIIQGWQEADPEVDVGRFLRSLANTDGVPDAPMKATDEWAMLAMKYAITEAVRLGMDAVAWTTGRIQAERFDLSKTIDRIQYRIAGNDPQGNLFYDVAAIRGSEEVFEERFIPISRVESLLGKEIAAKVANESGEVGEDGAGNRLFQLAGVDLRIGGEGMRTFYDEILTRSVNQWAKKFGGRVAATTIEWNAAVPVPPMLRGPRWTPECDVRMERADVHVMELTSAMREVALAGMPLFARDVGDFHSDADIGEVALAP